MTPESFEVIILVDSGIGNAIEALYAVEYCLSQNISVGFFMGSVNDSFQQYIAECYGKQVVRSSLSGVKTKNLIHSFTYQQKIDLQYENYFYVSADYHSTKLASETEQYLSIVKALYHSSYNSATLTKLKENYSPAVEKLNIEDKYVLY